MIIMIVVHNYLVILYKVNHIVHISIYLLISFLSDENLCLPSEKHVKRYVDDIYIPPYYNPSNYLYPYGISMAPFPFYNHYGKKPLKNGRNKAGKETIEATLTYIDTSIFIFIRMG